MPRAATPLLHADAAMPDAAMPATLISLFAASIFFACAMPDIARLLMPFIIFRYAAISMIRQDIDTFTAFITAIERHFRHYCHEFLRHFDFRYFRLPPDTPYFTLLFAIFAFILPDTLD
jgi:hypothetical protein